jgi:hypothetical protein
MDTHRLWQAVFRGARAAVLWGLVSAALTRVLMRAVTLVTEGPAQFTWAGTMVIAVVYVAALLPGAVALAYSAGRWPWVLFGGGVAFLAYRAAVTGLEEIAHAGGLTAWRWAGLTTLLTAMVCVYAAQVVLVHRAVRGRARTPAGAPVRDR